MLHGHVLGHHDGIEFYTIGQRKGLGITTAKPVYVVELDAENNRVVVGDDSALDRDEFTADRCNWHPFDKLTEPIEVTAKIRYNHPGTPATVTPLENNSRESETAYAAARHHARPGGGVLSGRFGGGWRLDCALNILRRGL